MEKSLTPRSEFIYLGLSLILPTRLNRGLFAIKIPAARRKKLIKHLTDILQNKTLSTGEASSMRGRLFFYLAWFQESRSYMSAIAARQYSKFPDTSLTAELIISLEFFLHTLRYDKTFLEGVKPLSFFNRSIAWLYTDGSLEKNKTVKGIGGLCFASKIAAPLWYGELIPPDIPGYTHIAPIEMYAIFRAINLFENEIRDKALWLFCDNMHSVGCLLKRSSMFRETENPRKRVFTESYDENDRRLTPEEHFLRLSDDIQRNMNTLAQEIWRRLTELNTVIWIEYVWTKVNLADDPSRGEDPIIPGKRIGMYHDIQKALRDSDTPQK